MLGVTASLFKCCKPHVGCIYLFRMKPVSVLVLLAYLAIVAHSFCGADQINFDFNAVSAPKASLKDLTCVKDTQIDFNFPQTASGDITVTNISAAATYKRLSYNGSDITMQFLNRDGVNQTYTLQEIGLFQTTAVANTSHINIANHPAQARAKYELSLIYKSSGKQTVVVSVYLSDPNTTAPTSEQSRWITRNNHAAAEGFRNFVNGLSTASTTVKNIAAVSLFNQADHSMFYTQQDTDKCGNYLLIRNVYELSTALAGITASPLSGSTATNQADTGNMLCWGSNTNLGTFQTHMRDNFPLWVGWWTVLIFWLALLIGEATTLNCFDRRFQNNRWTCWCMYSLFHLAHEEFFTRMARTVPMYICFYWQACVCAILYSKLGAQFTDATTIPWFAAIAWACSVPLQFVFGAFTHRMYNATLEKYNQRKAIKKLFDKQSNEAHIYEDRIDQCESTIYGSYYWMYVFGFACWVTFSTLCVNLIQQIPRERYDIQNQYWIGATLAAWGFDVFLVDPLLTLALGGTAFYRFRPYFYDYRLGQTYKEIEG